jgi:hypothetical protein
MHPEITKMAIRTELTPQTKASRRNCRATLPMLFEPEYIVPLDSPLAVAAVISDIDMYL